VPAIRTRDQKVTIGHHHFDFVGERQEFFTLKVVFLLTIVVAAISWLRVPVVAFLTACNQSVSAEDVHNRIGARCDFRLELTCRTAPVTSYRVSVIAAFRWIGLVVAAFRLDTRARTLAITSKARLNPTTSVAPISAVRVAVVTLFAADDDAVAAPFDASVTGGRARPTVINGAVGAAVVVVGVVVFALFTGSAHAVAANFLDANRRSQPVTGEPISDSALIAAIGRHVIAIVAGLTQG
jgi:hypothetical protein